MSRRRYSEEEEADLVALMAASAILIDDEARPQFTVIAEQTGVPRTSLYPIWERAGEETHRQVTSRLMRARAEVADSLGREWLDRTMHNIASNLPYITSAERFKPVTGEDKDGREYVIVPGLRADQAARAYREAHGLAITMGQRMGLVDAPEADDDGLDLSTAEGRMKAAEQLAALPAEVLDAARRLQQKE
jgi:hypothetical protein